MTLITEASTLGTRACVQANNAWKVLFLLFVVNLFNYFDRTIPAIIIEPLRKTWGLSDVQVGLAGTAFTVIYALAGVPLGRMADSGSRRKIMGWGLTVWSCMTAATGLANGFWTFLLVRIGVGIGEASYVPAASSLIADLFPSRRRGLAMGLFMLGLPLGLLLAYFTVGAMVRAFDSWRAPFFIAAVPGLVLAICIFFLREPRRGAADNVRTNLGAVSNPLRTILKIATFRWLVLAGLAFNFATYACTSFMVPMLQRYFQMPLEKAAVATGLIVGVTGLLGLTLGGVLADYIHQRWATGRLRFAALSMLLAAAFSAAALLGGQMEVAVFVALFSVGWLFSYSFFTCGLTAVQDVIEPRLRATAMALFFAALYLLGGGLGPLAVGYLSDHFAQSAMFTANAGEMTEAFKAQGLHRAMLLIPAALLVSMAGLCFAARHFVADAAAMRAGLDTPR